MARFVSFALLLSTASAASCDRSADAVGCADREDANVVQGLDDEVSLLQLTVSQLFYKKIVETGASYLGKVKQPGFLSKDHSIRLNFLSMTEGRWRDELDEKSAEQRFEVVQTGERIKFKDDDTELDGTIDVEGVVRGTMIHQGVPGGTFVLTPDLSGRNFYSE
eukprot:gnl/TRDRNA2_/TRDRNA2_86176_c0_seq1.p1 gnl/TRDRNA2_/TRDRNA2_86176_c0~~gnl/TRDRNA2_/TRDRNA2_86176_c0_seq1.p1  ORF type:complete len:174 (-),score=36.16 gnl/TRDRNA2_/TRDRNA2_86176_c0_seq1:41-532(-)